MRTFQLPHVLRQSVLFNMTVAILLHAQQKGKGKNLAAPSRCEECDTHAWPRVHVEWRC